MPVQTTREIEKTMRTVREMAEVQRDSYEALAENIADAQRRGMKLAEGGFRFMRLQKENARVTREWFANSMRLVQLQQRNAEFAQGWTSEAVKAVREQTQQNALTAEAIAQSVRKQQDSFGASPSSGWELTGTFSPLRLLSGGREGHPVGQPAGVGGHRGGDPAEAQDRSRGR